MCQPISWKQELCISKARYRNGGGGEARRGGATGKTARGAVQDAAGGTGHMTIHCSMVLSFPPTEIRALSLCRKERRVT